ncbi:MAG: hypothetical protein JWN70_5612, partial [Planctomycetaceae bacterium]|nr:hypothetical protein [Planctomycetaceae bacterium]
MYIRPWLQSLKSPWMPGKRSIKRRASDRRSIKPQVETLEERTLLAAFSLVTVIPNQGVFLSDGQTISEAPTEVTLRFSPGESIDPTTISASAVTITRAGLDGTLNTADDQSVPIGYIGPGDSANEVVVRFAQNLSDDQYQIKVLATASGGIGGISGDTISTTTFKFNLNLGAQVDAVVPQPVIHSQVVTVANSALIASGSLLTVSYGAYAPLVMEFYAGSVPAPNGHVFVDRTGGNAAVAAAIKAAITTYGTSLPATSVPALTSSVATNAVTITGAAFEPNVKFTGSASAITQASGALSQATDTVVVYFNEQMDPTTAQNPSNYRLFDSTPVTTVNVLNVAAAGQSFTVTLGVTSVTVSVPVAGTVALTASQLVTAINGATSAIKASYVSGNILTLTAGLGNSGSPDASWTQSGAFSEIRAANNSAVLLPKYANYSYNAQTGLSAAVLTFATALPTTTFNLQVGGSTESTATVTDAGAVRVGAVFSTQSYTTTDWIGDGAGASLTAYSGSDTDLFKFEATNGGQVTVTLDPNAALDGVIKLYDANGNIPVLVASQTVDSSGVGFSETLTFAATVGASYFVEISSAGGTTGSYQLLISNNTGVGTGDNNSSFGTATGLGDLGTSEVAINGQIQAQNDTALGAGNGVLMPPLPGGADEPGHRDLPAGAFPEAPAIGQGTAEAGHGIADGTTPTSPVAIPTITYEFPQTYGPDLLLNQITVQQRQMARQIFQIFSYYSGVQFQEVTTPVAGTLLIATGNIHEISTSLQDTLVTGATSESMSLAIINANFLDVSTGLLLANDNTYGGAWMKSAFQQIGHMLGLGSAFDVPGLESSSISSEEVYPGDNDLVHLLRLFPNNSSDIDLYKFNVTQTGTLSAQTLAERLNATNLLNTTLTLYREDNGIRTVVARNDDYYSKDSALEIAVTPGTYYIGVTSTGNDNYDPTISNSGFGGTTDGQYQLKLNFTPLDPALGSALLNVDATDPQALDGDHDGEQGGVYNTWFTVAPTNKTFIVDKLASAGGTGTAAQPFNTISAALTAATTAGAGSVVRIVGNGGADGDISTVGDAVPYAIGKDYNAGQTPLSDGTTFQVPQGVTVMIDAGALIKTHAQIINVGSPTTGGINGGQGALQVLGTPAGNVTFTSWRDDASGSIDDGTNGAAIGGDWGGLVFRQDSDSSLAGAFLNTVNHATIQYGGGQVSVNSAAAVVYNAIDLETSRPTLTNNRLLNNADAAISANPDSFRADDGRIGPDIHGNVLLNNSTNGLFVRISTSLGGSTETLNVNARFDDTDITHVFTQNLLLNARAANDLNTALSASLIIDPGTIVKLSGARIETGLGNTSLIAEGTDANPIRFTSELDDRFGAGGGGFDLKNDGVSTPSAGNWSGFFIQPTSTASFDHVSISYAGGTSEISGNSDSFNAIEVVQARLRIANSELTDNLGGLATGDRAGRGPNDNSTIFVRGAQPVIVNNVFRDNVGSVISINANSLQGVIMPDSGRSTGAVDTFSQFDDNYGPLVRLNAFANSSGFLLGSLTQTSTLGMTIRAETLTIGSVWDDTDIAHVVTNLIKVDEFHTYGGLRLQSSPNASLVVKLSGVNAGFSASGDPLEITDRIGGTIQIVGQPGYPVILTSLKDDSVSAGFKPDGLPQYDTNGDNNAGGASVGAPGDWKSISFDQYSNDRNVAIVNETEPAINHGNDINVALDSQRNIIGFNAQSLGNLAPNDVSGDENRRLGFTVNGFISPDSPTDVDVYSFTADPGTEVWIDTDATSQRLDLMLELVDSSGLVLAQSLNSQAESLGTSSLGGSLFNTVRGVVQTPAQIAAGNSDLNSLTRDANLGGDFYTSNFHDAGFRAVLPGTIGGGAVTYFVRVRSQPSDPNIIPEKPSDTGYGTLTSGSYQLQVRLQQVDEIAGSTVRYADIHYATDGIVLQGLPAHSPLMGEAGEGTGDNQTATSGGTQNLGALLETDRNTISVAGSLANSSDIDFYSFTVDYNQIGLINGLNNGSKTFPVNFDIDWADGLTRPDTTIAIYDNASPPNLIYVGTASNLADDQQSPTQLPTDYTDLSRGSLGTLDPSIGTVNLPAGVYQGATTGSPTKYFVAVFSAGQTPTGLTATFTAGASPEVQRVRLEPIDSVKRLVEDHIGSQGYVSNGLNVLPVNGPLFNTVNLAVNARPFTLSDVNLFVTTASGLAIYDPFNGKLDATYSTYGGSATYNDLDMRPDGQLFAVRNTGVSTGELVPLNTSATNPLTGAAAATPDKIADVNPSTSPTSYQQNNASPDALAFHKSGTTYDYLVYAAANVDNYGLSTPAAGSPVELDPNGPGTSKLYRAIGNGASIGSAEFSQANTGAVGDIYDGVSANFGTTTGMQYFSGTGFLYGVSSTGLFYRIIDTTSVNTANGNPDSDFVNAPDIFPSNLAVSVFNLKALGNIGGAAGFTGLAEAPLNVKQPDGTTSYQSFLFATTNDGHLIAINPQNPSQKQFIFDTTNDFQITGADSNLLALSGLSTVNQPTGLGFSPVDFNLWHVTSTRSGDISHGINATADNSRSAVSGGSSLYFGFDASSSSVTGFSDLRSNPSLSGSTYAVPGGTSGSLVTNNFSLQGYTASDQPTLYFNYFLAADADNSDSTRVYISTDNGTSWQSLITNSTPSGRNLFTTTNNWRQARVDLSPYVGSSQAQLRFDFTTSGRSGTTTDVATGRKVASNDPNDPGFAAIPGDSNNLINRVVNVSTSEGFYIDDIIIGFAERGEMVTSPTGSVPSGFSATGVTLPPTAQLSGQYQLEVRRGTEYQGLSSPLSGAASIFRQFDINDRLTTGQTVSLGTLNPVGNTVSIWDGVVTRIFEFTTGGASPVTVGAIAVDITGYTNSSTPGALAARALALQNAINSNAGFLSRGTVAAKAVSQTPTTASGNSDRIDIFGAARVKVTNLSNPSPVNESVAGNGIENHSAFANDYPIAGFSESVSGLASGTDGSYAVSGKIGNTSLSANADSDFYQVHLNAGQRLHVDLGLTSATGSHYWLGLFTGLALPSATSKDGVLDYTATATGNYFLGVFGDDGYVDLPINPLFAGLGQSLAAFGMDTFDYLMNFILETPNSSQAANTLTSVDGISVQSYALLGDENLKRQQGQIIIEDNSILRSSGRGIYLNDSTRVTNPNPGAALSTPIASSEQLVTGIYIQNNVIAGFGTAGVDILGDNLVNTTGTAIRPFVKVVNNTIVGKLTQVSSTLVSLSSTNLGGAMTTIDFEDFITHPPGTQNPVYNFPLVTGIGAVSVSFGGNFEGQTASTGGTLSTLSDTSPSTPLKLDVNAPKTKIVDDPNPLLFNEILSPNTVSGCPISVLFSQPVNAVALTGGTFDAVGSVSIEAYDVDGNSLGIVANSLVGTETLGLAVTDGTNLISGISIYATGDQNQQFTIDNLKFGASTSIIPTAPTGVGVRVGAHTTATLMNNAFVGTATAVSIDPTAATTVLEANLYQHNTANFQLGGNTGNNSLLVTDDVQLFVNPRRDNYYPAANSPLIDSSRSTFGDRDTYYTVANPLGIPKSPIIAPLTDRFGQLRVDDISTSPPNQPGLGQNPFQDRGALERADIDGGVLVPLLPGDNDGVGVDLDSDETEIWIDAANPNNPAGLFSPLTTLKFQLVDTGIGIDDLTVNASDFLMIKNGVPLVEGVDYLFTYNSSSNECIFTSASTFALDSRYQIVVNAQGITDFAGNVVQSNQTVPLTPTNLLVPSPFNASLLYFTYIITDGVNQAPAVAGPAAVSMNEDTTFSFTGGNLVTVSDSDAFLGPTGDPRTGAAGGRVKVTLSVPVGFGNIVVGSTVNLLANGGTITGTGINGDPFVINGRIIDINTTLSGLKYTPVPDFPGTIQPAVPLTIVTD